MATSGFSIRLSVSRCGTWALAMGILRGDPLWQWAVKSNLWGRGAPPTKVACVIRGTFLRADFFLLKAAHASASRRIAVW